jgi:hypothetical protein
MTNVIELAAGLATVGKSEEQLALEAEAEKLAQKRARWDKAVEARAALKAPFRCEAQISNGNWTTRFHQCDRNANYHREQLLDGWDKDSPMIVRHYCKQHDPVSQNEKQQAKWAEEKRAREAKWAFEARCQARSELIAKAVGHLTNEQLVKLAAFLQTQEGFKKQ